MLWRRSSISLVMALSWRMVRSQPLIRQISGVSGQCKKGGMRLMFHDFRNVRAEEMGDGTLLGQWWDNDPNRMDEVPI
jgi:hypothetical protein